MPARGVRVGSCARVPSALAAAVDSLKPQTVGGLKWGALRAHPEQGEKDPEPGGRELRGLCLGEGELQCQGWRGWCEGRQLSGGRRTVCRKGGPQALGLDTQAAGCSGLGRGCGEGGGLRL